ncbi:site-specific integrase [Achromobacter kerstersii]|uniref:Tyr recombinase domain-containing protein n=1 Tax=Achromobacter kerstersii TaxID=1353890 RepID=A0A6S7AJV7_9BURK|nr:hypothetical protein [Achromobacter kerstersii]CAB3722982.1 hypothetical protein LMG3441_03977 [Achromobacter kerstersii]
MKKEQKPEKSTGYESLRYFIPSSLLDSQTNRPVMARARKRAMTPLTYRTLLENQQRMVLTQSLKEQTAANRATALRGFLRANCLHVDDVVGDEMRGSHAIALDCFINSLATEGKSAQSMSNSKSAFRNWKDAVVAHDAIQAVQDGKPTPFQSALFGLLKDQPVQRVAKNAGIPKDMLHGWLRGKVPRGSNAKYILRLESLFGMTRHSLVQLSGMRLRGERTMSPGEAPTPIQYRDLLGTLTREIFGLKPQPDSPLREQWKELLIYKTATVPSLKRTRRGRWRFSPCPIHRATATNWALFLDGKEVASAHYGWMKVSSFLGWLAMPPSYGGAGISADQLQTLAWLAIPDHLEPFLNWRRERIGKRNQGALQHLAFVAALVRPQFGYLRQRPELKLSLPPCYHGEDWNVLCDRQFEFTELLANAYRDEVEVSRDSFEPLNHILELPNPMDAVADMIQRMRADRPTGAPIKEAIWARNVVLIKILASNPLRRRNLAHLTWRIDNTGTLYQRVDKSWWIRIPRNQFKNSYGAAGDLPYDSPVHSSAWVDIEKYLFLHRPRLQQTPTDLLFLTRKKPNSEPSHQPWTDLGKTVFFLTARYLPKCRGFGCHAFRHLAATSILKAEGGDFKTAALVLNDRVATVEKHYARLRSGDGNTRMAELLDSAFSRM